MSNTVNKIKGHPGFMPFGCAGVKKSTEKTQSQREQQLSNQEKASDAKKSN